MPHIIDPYRPFPVAGGFDKTDLVAWYDFESDGSDSHTGGYDLTETNTPTYVSGKVGSCLNLVAASNQMLEYADGTPFDITDALSIGAWVKFNATGTNEGIVSKYVTTGNQRAYVLNKRATDDFNTTISSDGTSSGGSIAQANGSTTIVSDVWYFVVMTFEPSTALRLYVDGVEDAADTSSVPASIYNSNASFDIGRYADLVAQDLDGQIDSVFVFNRVLSADEISDLYNSGNGVSYSDLATL